MPRLFRTPPLPQPIRRTFWNSLSGRLTLLLTGLLMLQPLRAQEPVLDLATFPRSEVVVETAAGTRHAFQVWIADTEARQRQGLMFVRDLPAEQGMLFVNQPPRPAYFWMKNTYIPLDMLFVDAQGRILKIHERTTPLSLDPLGVDAPVRAVFEIRGGESARRGIRVGDRLRHPAFRAR